MKKNKIIINGEEIPKTLCIVDTANETVFLHDDEGHGYLNTEKVYVEVNIFGDIELIPEKLIF